MQQSSESTEKIEHTNEPDSVDQEATIDQEQEEAIDVPPSSEELTSSTNEELSDSTKIDRLGRFDWFAVGVVIILAAIFATATRLNVQPSASLVPASVLSATGCGLLITALRKLHTSKGAGLPEAAVGGLFLALFQFIAAISYPGVVQTMGNVDFGATGFFSTWSLVVLFTIIFSMAGAAFGHLAFAPLRPLPAKEQADHAVSEEAISDDEQTGEEAAQEEQEASPDDEQTGEEVAQEEQESEDDEPDLPEILSEEQTTDNDEEENNDDAEGPVAEPMKRASGSFLITVLLLGLAPTLIGYVFAAAFDFTQSLNQFVAGPYPTLRLLSGLLPWQVPVPVLPQGTFAGFIMLTLLWRIPLLLGNPHIFDIQALEPYLFNAAGLALALLTLRDTHDQTEVSPIGWRTLLIFEALLGLLMVTPAVLWLNQGIEGVLRLQTIAIPIRTLHLLNPLTFTLDIVTGPVFCIITALVVLRLQSGRGKSRQR